jgi:hypothetical protein
MVKNTLIRRAAKTTAALGIALGASLGAADAASAAGVNNQVCTGNSNHVICLGIWDMGNNTYAVHVGIDVSMTQAQAQQYVDQPGQALTASLMGDDVFDNALFAIPQTYEVAGGDGLSAEFDILVGSGSLNEDWDGQDELYAKVKLYNASSGTYRTFLSPNIEDNF